MQLTQALNSELTWLAITALIGYVANTIVSRGLVSRVAPTSPIRRAIRALHGFLDKIDPPAALVLLAIGSLCVPLCSGCGRQALPTPREAMTLAFNVTDLALETAVKTAPQAKLDALVPVVDKMPVILEALKTGANACDQADELSAVIAAFACDDCTVALKVVKEVCQ